MTSTIVTVNRGSSSLKLAAFELLSDGTLTRFLSANATKIGQAGAKLSSVDDRENERGEQPLTATSHNKADEACIEWLAQRVDFGSVVAVGHRIVHGGPRYRTPQWITAEMMAELERISPFDPEHMPFEIGIVRTIGQRFPQLRQVAAFDTAFHRHMPLVARMLPIPRRYQQQGVERYGFHGLSYAYLMEELARLNPRAAAGRVILAHLGAGASMAAVLAGKSIDTSMAFTPTAGLPMATRSGDLDPGLVSYLAQSEQMTADEFHQMVNGSSGLLGISETTGDMQQLLADSASDERAREAVDVFCYQAKKWIGAYVAALGGLDALVFSGGIGEHAAEVRQRICTGLGCLGIELDAAANAAGRSTISSSTSRALVYVIRTDEELMIARSCAALITAE
jgi:acetate kinase